MSTQLQSVIAVVPAAGVGSRMKADRPKQYLKIHDKTILEHTIEKLLSHPQVAQIVVAISDDDPYYPDLALNLNPQVIRVSGGSERADSVLSALNYIAEQQLSDWVMVHDAARPCVQLSDIDKLISGAMSHDVGAILAAPVRDTMKRGAQGQIEHTVERADLWHALTPQMFRAKPLWKALSEALQQGASITDEASAFEWKGLSPALVAGRSDNFKITQPEDLALAEFYLSQNKE
ncbi:MULTISPECIES: 2-C-methyl-D-erythritol 4-phosphate cytidylyltransferase [Vibrio]|jgi:2-C-methyl-D-erythritol 4-phosphate cytidylyltransferase|uniref:2-C-methyl-D-erythritol 4-phosphate cytidylyltransferase n=1 Tax=Vibrio TaxID=662 RepID=UPI0002E26D99|nr:MULTISPECIES: 2-C-methyl-D-erythritol 4-phosphate cytidylyltransferase [Vibrio]ANP75599.1 2-C-methyl-D-erythritol 4-phosphate cytidylyltransferase [Vibrio crassostreae 9CS106]MCC4891642.1 2-C-methyl-D-erythritol 4-phosphate cytidylyltransferase [Vibrio sp. F13]OCH54155.1 2-C-methyl-D-erythritol 4-phosphate cytidylyltransferase [Vibrio sp. ZF57]OEE90514.1 2-C-methyl-D-erythritol 4-phosphate cytidylyltransferase [Vibrio crassostreae 9ZC88]TKF70514.1 2-C-methyl-D-erythritol 4-phosphate cytidyl